MALDTSDKLVEALSCMDNTFAKLVRIVQGSKEKFDADEYMETTTKIYNVCTEKWKPAWTLRQACYVKYKTMLKNYVTKKVLGTLEQKHDQYFLVEFISEWSDHLLIVRWLAHFLRYLDRFYIPKHRLPTIEETGIECFRLLVYNAFHEKIYRAFVTLMYRERKGEWIDRSVLKRTTEFYIAVNMGNMEMYETILEKAVLMSTEAYYKKLASKHILEDTSSQYIIMAEQYLEQEKDRVFSFLHSSTLPKLIKILQKELLLTYYEELLRKGLAVMLQKHKTEDLRRMYRLFDQCDGGLAPNIAPVFKQHVVNVGLSLVKQFQSASSEQQANKKSAGSQKLVFIEKAIELHDEHFGNISSCFNDNITFHKALGEAFEIFLNKDVDGVSTAELLANYADNILKKRSGGDDSTDPATEERLDKIVRLFGHIHNKDLFAEFHQKKLARRLLCDRNANDNHEKYFLMKLNQQNGASFTSKMHRLFTDLALAKEKQEAFKHYLKNNAITNRGVELHVDVLTSGFWPTCKASNIHLPHELAECVETFRRFYGQSEESRRLTWITSLGYCTMIGKFDTKPMELLVTTHQAATLMLFNGSERLSYAEIREQLNLHDEELIRLLYSLSCAKYRILIKEPESMTLSKDDVFEFNAKFTDKMRRIKIPHPFKEDEKKKAMINRVDTDRRYHIDAAVVRIMKSRKALGFQELLGECVKQLSHSFKPDAKFIKRRIEDLVERNFLEREADDVNMFRYVA